MNTYSKFNANRFEEIITEMCISKSEVARYAGVATVSIYRLHQGTSCRTRTINKIAKVLQIKPEELILPEEPVQTAETIVPEEPITEDAE